MARNLMGYVVIINGQMVTSKLGELVDTDTNVLNQKTLPNVKVIPSRETAEKFAQSLGPTAYVMRLFKLNGFELYSL